MNEHVMKKSFGRIVGVWLMLAALVSCQSPKQETGVPECTLRHELLLDDDFLIGKVKGMVLLDDSIPVVVNVMKMEKPFQTLNVGKKKTMEWGSWGQGPDDMLFPTSLYGNGMGTLSFWDMNKRRYTQARMNAEGMMKSLGHRFQGKDSLFHSDVLPVKGGGYIAIGLYENFRLALLDGEGRFREGIGECPARDEREKKVSGFVRSEVYQGKLGRNVSGDKFVCASLKADMLSFYRLTDGNRVALVKEHIHSYPDYSYDTGAMEFSAPIYYLDVCATDQYVYALYSGKNYKDSKDKAFVGDEIRVYDWEGELVKVLHLDVDVNVMAVTTDDRRIYAIAYHPDPVLVAFPLN